MSLPKRKKIRSSFLGKYAVKSELQTIIQSGTTLAVHIDNILNSITGGGLSIGYSLAKVDASITEAKTTTLCSLNIADEVEAIWEEICSWFA